VVLEGVLDDLYKLVAKHLGTASTTTGTLLNWLRGDLGLMDSTRNALFLETAKNMRPEEGAFTPIKKLQEIEQQGAKQVRYSPPEAVVPWTCLSTASWC
jgi:hypothetical protein